jgi:WS/DGAT/MGAT family acyltransferase
MNEALQLARDQSAQPWHQLSVLIVDGPAPALEQLGLLIEQRIAYSPRFRQKLAGTGLQSWIDDRGFRVGGHLRAERVTARLEDRLAALLAEPLERLHPLWDATVIDGLPGPRWALVVRTHPALIDGRDHVHLLHELLDEQPTLIEGTAPRWEPMVDEPRGFGSLLRNVADPLQSLRGAAAGLGGLAEQGLRQVSTETTPRHVAAVEFDLADLARAAHGHGVRVHDIVVAMVTGAVRGAQLEAGADLHDPVALVPLAVDDDGMSAMGCLVAPQFVSLPVTTTTAGERLGAIATLTQARVDSARLVGALDLVEVAGFAPPTMHAVAAALVTNGRSHEVLLVNVPGPASGRWLAEQRVRALHAFESTVDDQTISVGVTSLDGRISFAATATTPLPNFARHVADELGVLTRGAN